MSKRIITIIKVSIIFSIIISMLLASIVSQDTHHLAHCEDDDCFICAIIKIAQSIINLSAIIYVCVCYGFLIYFILSKIKIVKVFSIQNSLIFQMVQLNE